VILSFAYLIENSIQFQNDENQF